MTAWPYGSNNTFVSTFDFPRPNDEAAGIRSIVQPGRRKGCRGDPAVSKFGHARRRVAFRSRWQARTGTGCRGGIYPHGGAEMAFMPGDSKHRLPKFVNVEWMVATPEYDEEWKILSNS